MSFMKDNAQRNTSEPYGVSVEQRLLEKHRVEKTLRSGFWIPSTKGEILVGVFKALEVKYSKKTGAPYYAMHVQTLKGLVQWATPAWVEKELEKRKVREDDYIVVEYGGSRTTETGTRSYYNVSTYPASEV